MSLPVTIENDALRIEVYPHFGGKVLSVIDKADDYELLFDYPAELPTACAYDQPYAMSYHAGWDECFPAVEPGAYPNHPYKGIAVPDHGELWSLPTTAVPTRDGITTEWMGLRFGYRLSRRISLDGPGLSAAYLLQNLAPFDLHFVWAMHALGSVHVPIELEMPGGTYRLAHDAGGQRLDLPFEWPTTADGQRLARPADLPARRGWQVYSDEPIFAPAVVRYPSRGRTLTVEYGSPDSLRAYWGIWINTGGWAGQQHFSVQPITGRFGDIDRSSRDGSAGLVGAGGRMSWQVRWSVAGA